MNEERRARRPRLELHGPHPGENRDVVLFGAVEQMPHHLNAERDLIGRPALPDMIEPEAFGTF